MLIMMPRETSGHVSEQQRPAQSNNLSDPSLVEEEDDGVIEVPQIEEIEDEVPKRKPLRRTTFRSRNMMGRTRYLGHDRIKPA